MSSTKLRQQKALRTLGPQRRFLVVIYCFSLSPIRSLNHTGHSDWHTRALLPDFLASTAFSPSFRGRQVTLAESLFSASSTLFIVPALYGPAAPPPRDFLQTLVYQFLVHRHGLGAYMEREMDCNLAKWAVMHRENSSTCLA